MRIALYLRVSTSNQRQAQTIDQQLDQLQHALEERQWTVAQAHIFRDDPALQFPLLTRIYKVASKAGTLTSLAQNAPKRSPPPRVQVPEEAEEESAGADVAPR